MKSSSLPKRVALVYDRVNTPFGGAERVLLSLHELFPDAPLYTSVYDAKVADWAKVFEVRTSYIQEIPFSAQKHRQLLPLMPSAFEQFNLDEFELVISISSAESKAVRPKSGALHICYVLTPTRYLWSHTYEYQTGILAPLKALFFSKMRKWDYKVAQKPDLYIPISKLIQKRVEKYYRRTTAPVIYPPFTLKDKSSLTQDNFNNLKDYYLVVSRLVGYKKIKLCIQTCIELQKQLVIIGNGPDYFDIQEFIELFDPQHNLIHWFPSVSDEELVNAYKSAKAFLLPAEEDFGITALEAQSVGIPVVVFKHSGAAEVVIDNKTGIHFDEQTVEALKKAILKLEQQEWNSDAIKSHTEQYNEQSFLTNFAQSIEIAWKHHLLLKKGSS